MNVPKSGSTILNTQRRNVFLSVFGLGSQMNPLTNLMAHLGAFCQDIVWWQYWNSCHIFIPSECILDCGRRPGSTELKRNCKGNNRLDQKLLSNFKPIFEPISISKPTLQILSMILFCPLLSKCVHHIILMLKLVLNIKWFLLLLLFSCCGTSFAFWGTFKLFWSYIYFELWHPL